MANTPSSNPPAEETPVAAPETPVAAPETPVAAPETPVAAPETPVAAPETPVAAPETPVAAPEVPVAAPETPVAPPVPAPEAPTAPLPPPLPVIPIPMPAPPIPTIAAGPFPMPGGAPIQEPVPMPPPPLPDAPLTFEPGIVVDFPKTKEIEDKTIADFTDWIIDEMTKSLVGVTPDKLSGLLQQEAGKNPRLMNTLSVALAEKIGPPDAINKDNIEATYNAFKMLLDNLNEKDENGTPVVFPEVDSWEKMVKLLEEFNNTVAPPLPATVAPDPADDAGNPPPVTGPTPPVIPDNPDATPPTVEPATPDTPEKRSNLRKYLILGTALAVTAILAAAGSNTLYDRYAKDKKDESAQTDDKTPPVAETAPTPVPTEKDETAPAPVSTETAEPSPAPGPTVITPIPQPTAEPAPTPEATATAEPVPVVITPPVIDKIFYVCRNFGTPENCRYIGEYDPQLSGCSIDQPIIPYKPLTATCLKGGYPDRVYATPYQINYRSMYTGPSEGENVTFTLVLQK
jgi:hypothetical protein